MEKLLSAYSLSFTVIGPLKFPVTLESLLILKADLFAVPLGPAQPGVGQPGGWLCASECLGVSSGGVGQQRLAWVQSTDYKSAGLSPFEGDGHYCHYPIVWPQATLQGGNTAPIDRKLD